MRQIERQVDRYLTLLRDKIRQRGYTQLEMQQELRGGRSYISQLLTRQKALRVEQVLLILKVLAVDPAEFFAEIYEWPVAPRAVSRPVPVPVEAGQGGGQRRQLEELRGQIQGLVALLLEKDVIGDEELRVAAAAVLGEE